MGYSKATLIQREFSDEIDVNQLVEAAYTQPVATLRETIRETRTTSTTSSGSRDVTRMTRIVVSVPEQAGKNIKAALALAMEQNDMSLPVVFEHIVHTYAEEHLDPKAIQRMKRRLAKEAKDNAE